MNWAWALKLEPAPKFTLLALADAADDSGKCWPSVNTLAIKTSQSERTVQRHLSQHKASGLLLAEARFRADRSQSSNLYTLNMGEGDKLSRSPARGDASRRHAQQGGGDTGDAQTTNESSSILKQQQQEAAAKALDSDAAVVVGVESLVFPKTLSPAETEAARGIVRTLKDVDLAQAVLDEYSGRCAQTAVRNPVRYLAVMAARARHGEFVPELGLRVREDRVTRARNAAALEASLAISRMKADLRIGAAKPVREKPVVDTPSEAGK